MKYNLIFIDPNAYQIYSDKLKYYDAQQKNQSSLYERVVCLPYKFEKVLPLLKNHYLINLKEGLSDELGKKQKEMERKKVDWISCIKSFVETEHCERVESLLERIDNLELEGNWKLNLELLLKMAVNLSANNQNDKGSQYFKEFYGYLHRIVVEGINVEVGKAPPVVKIKFDRPHCDSDKSPIEVHPLNKFIETLSEFCEGRATMVINIPSELRGAIEKLKSVETYLNPFENKKMDFEDYVTMRREQISDVEKFRTDYQKFQEGDLKPYDDLESKIKNIEESVLNEIVGMK